ncbi:hypothetical protein K1720_04910 [Thermococcus argininiproducens]|uniref:Uncharacterized protein n=1 Tax=Thermococcus argininiproducens TaxID=2866384 RepID=A0A9E7MCI9_9EURY|nr:hypothetical protein [Thermococcus argininiproducens]USH00772.1 hypothetical protein K1720_04910 [Thermococcus argininiproducens]
MKKWWVLLTLILSLSLMLSSVAAHFDPPGSPAIQVTVYLLGVSLNEDMDDGWNGYADIVGKYKIVHTGHESKSGDISMIYYDWDTLKGRMGYISKILLYTHNECSPLSEITVDVNLEEYNDILPNTAIGSGSIKISKPGRYIINSGKGKVLIEVKTTPAVLYSEECSYFHDQPDEYASSIVTSSGGYVYDWQLANMMKMWIANRTGYANMVFIFNQCFGGGMIDDLKEKLKGTGDAAFLSASKHDETSWGLADGYTPASWPEMSKRGFTRPEGYYPKEVGEELERTGRDAPTMKEMAKRAEQQDARGPYGLGFKETPQYTSIGKGDSIKIGKKADGSNVASKHAILFAGDADSKRHWNNLDRAYKALKKQGFTDENIIALAGNGKTMPDGTNVPTYVDGPGTKKALFEAIINVSKKMNKNEQLIFWVSDHGNRERTETALDKAIKDPVKQTVPPRETAKRTGQISWDLDEEFLKVIKLDPNNQPYVSILVEATPVVIEYGEYFLENIKLYVNENELELELIEPIIAYDEEPDLDAYELVYLVDERILGEENLIEVEWSGDAEMFVEYNIMGLMISTGGINELEPKPIEVVEEQTLFDLLREYVPTYNENADNMPGFIKRIAGNERIDLEITLENESILNIGVVTEGGYIMEFSKGKISNPTMRVWTNEGVARRIINSEDPASTGVNALKMGEIRYSGVGFGRTLRIFVVKIVIKVYRIVEIIGDLFG